jgi:hypothetical protein
LAIVFSRSGNSQSHEQKFVHYHDPVDANSKGQRKEPDKEIVTE